MSDNFDIFEELEFDEESEYEEALKDRVSLDTYNNGVYEELEDNPFGWTSNDFIEDDIALSDEELDKMEDDYYKSNKSDDEFYETFNDVGSLSDLDNSNFDDMPVLKKTYDSSILPVAYKKHKHFSLKSFINSLKYTGAGCLIYKKENGRLFVLLEKRATGMSFSDQWSIPGGGSESRDECDLDTALRETNEEIDYFHKSFIQNYYEKADRLHTSHWLIYKYTYFIIKLDKKDYHYVWGPQPGEVSNIRWFNIKMLPKNCHKTIRWLIFIAKLKNLMK